MVHTRKAGKERITISLSRGAAKFLRTFRARVKAPSISALFETILEDLRGGDEMAHLNAKVRAHYDSLPDADVREDAAWGRVGEAALTEGEIEAGRPNPEPSER